MKVSTNVEESLSIELLQKGFQITEGEIKSNATLKLTVIKKYIIIIYIFNYFRKKKEIISHRKRSQ